MSVGIYISAVLPTCLHCRKHMNGAAHLLAWQPRGCRCDVWGRSAVLIRAWKEDDLRRGFLLYCPKLRSVPRILNDGGISKHATA